MTDSDGLFVAQLPDSVCAPRQARQQVEDWLVTRAVPETVRTDVVLVVSELVTNAVVHAHSEPFVEIDLDDERVHVAVHDRSVAPPVVRAGSAEEFGLRIVDAVGSAWGWQSTLTGKHVWADVPIRE